jgi:hypothetical protein
MAYTALSLESLPDSDAAKLATLLAGNRGLDADATRLAETSEGNPLFIEELVASVAERPDAAGTELPNTIRGLLSARLDACRRRSARFCSMPPSSAKSSGAGRSSESSGRGRAYRTYSTRSKPAI